MYSRSICRVHTAEWDTHEALALSPVEIEERIRKWGLDDHLKGALSHVRQDVLLKRELTGRVRLSSYLHFLRFFPLPAVQNALLDKVRTRRHYLSC